MDTKIGQQDFLNSRKQFKIKVFLGLVGAMIVTFGLALMK